jgi:hypothetical protein
MQTQPRKISCKTASTYSQLLLDGRLTSAERAELDLHAASCQACEALIDGLRFDSGLLSEWTPALTAKEPGDSFNARILAAISAEPSMSPSPRSNDWWQIPCAIALTSLVCVCAGLLDRSQNSLPILNSMSFLKTGQISASAVSLVSWWNLIVTSLQVDISQIRSLSVTSVEITIGCIALAANLAFIARARSKHSGDRLV